MDTRNINTATSIHVNPPGTFFLNKLYTLIQMSLLLFLNNFCGYYEKNRMPKLNSHKQKYQFKKKNRHSASINGDCEDDTGGWH